MPLTATDANGATIQEGDLVTMQFRVVYVTATEDSLWNLNLESVLLRPEGGDPDIMLCHGRQTVKHQEAPF